MTFWTLPFMRYAAEVGLLAGSALAVIGIFTATRSVSFAGLAASQLAALGTVVGLVLGFHLGATALALAFVLAGMLALAELGRSRRTSPDSWVAVFYILGSGMAVLILSKSPRGEAETMGLFFGNILGLGVFEVWEARALAVATLAAMALWVRRWIWLAVDPAAAELSGLKVARWNLLFQTLFAAAITLAIHLFGVLLSFAYLVLPATAALLVARRVNALFIWVVAISALGTLLGFELSYRWDFPTGPFVATLLALFTLTAWVWARVRRN